MKNRIVHIPESTPEGRLSQSLTDLAFCGFLWDLEFDDPAIQRIHDAAWRQFVAAKREIKEGKPCE